jgi:nucleoid-associated protein YgaU
MGNRTGRIIAAVVLIAALIIAYVFFANMHGEPKPAPAPAVAPAPPSGQTSAVAAAKTGPQFDVLRVDSAGNTVIAGRADPGAVVTIKDGTNVLGTVTADANGAFAFLPDHPLPPGPHQLTLSEAGPNGQIVQGETSATVDVAANPSGQSLAVITGPNGSRIVSGQGPVPGSLGIGSVDYDANGHAIFSGTAHAGDHIALALNGTNLGTAVAGADGRWSFTAQVPRNSGTLQVTDTSKPGIAALSAPFALETLKTAVAEGHIVIDPGQNLWLIARRIYGHGMLYTLIYSANSKLIHDPNLIFPGQAFAVPKQK